MDALHDLLVGCAGAMAPEQFNLNMIERVDIGGAKEAGRTISTCA
jgi:hypothetical protein